MFRHPDLDDLDEAGEDRVPAHSDQRHVGEDLGDHHGGQSRHLRPVPGGGPVSRGFVPPRTFRVVLSGEAGAASTAPEHPSLAPPGTRFRWPKHRRATDDGPEPSPAFGAKSPPAAGHHGSASGDAGRQRGACVRGPGAGVEPRRPEPLQAGAAGRLRRPPTRPEHQEPLGSEERGCASVQMSRSAEQVDGSRHVDLETSTARD